MPTHATSPTLPKGRLPSQILEKEASQPLKEDQARPPILEQILAVGKQQNIGIFSLVQSSSKQHQGILQMHSLVQRCLCEQQGRAEILGILQWRRREPTILIALRVI